MKLERSNIEFAIWRKKVDKSLFEHNGTTIPDWACRMWDLETIYGGVTSRRDPKAEASIHFESKIYKAWVTTAPYGRRRPAYRLWYLPDLTFQLKKRFLMSYMRSLEGALEREVDAEDQIPFWEFLDLEFDANKHMFHLVAYYTQKPSFPNLFFRLIGSPPIQKLNDEILGKHPTRIYKQHWRSRSDLPFEIGAKNVIYMLLDTKAKLLYIGEADDLVRRLTPGHECIRNWDYFRYNVLPDALAPYRLALERMLIRDFAAVLENSKGVAWKNISGCKLANDRVDIGY
jgi:hypothetical protein